MRTEKYSMTHSQALQVLNLNAGASKKRLKTAYRKAAMRNHPDKGGSQEDFIIVKNAYDLLKEQGTTEQVKPEYDFSHLEGFGNMGGGVTERVYYRERYPQTPTEEELRIAYQATDRRFHQMQQKRRAV